MDYLSKINQFKINYLTAWSSAAVMVALLVVYAIYLLARGHSIQFIFFLLQAISSLFGQVWIAFYSKQNGRKHLLLVKSRWDEKKITNTSYIFTKMYNNQTASIFVLVKCQYIAFSMCEFKRPRTHSLRSENHNDHMLKLYTIKLHSDLVAWNVETRNMKEFIHFKWAIPFWNIFLP